MAPDLNVTADSRRGRQPRALKPQWGIRDTGRDVAARTERRSWTGGMGPPFGCAAPTSEPDGRPLPPIHAVSGGRLQRWFQCTCS